MEYSHYQQELIDALARSKSLEYWTDPDVVGACVVFLDDPLTLTYLDGKGKQNGVNTWLWRKALEQMATAQRNGHTEPAPTAPPVTPKPELLAPPLPQRARVKASLAEGAAPWLESYISHSAKWSPRAANGFHAAVGLWILSTIAARRICVELGAAVYPTLFMALVARSTLYAKTTTAKIGIDAVRQAGCGYLLAADRATPQALIRSMSGYLPDDYGSLAPEKQDVLRLRNAFAAQRGWYFEEWGGLLQQMTRRDSPMAEFHGLLRVLDDGYETFESETIQRGLDHLDSPYLALLGSATPHDLAKFLAPGAAWWHDGFWPRIALIVPLPEELPSMRRRSLGSARLPHDLVAPLQHWHHALGIPHATIEPAKNAEGKLTGKWQANREPLPCHHLTVPSEVKEAYDCYNEGLMQLIINGDAPPDLEACYGRLHDKALRIAMLLTSFGRASVLTMGAWAYAQQVTEQWRLMLHQAIVMAGDGQPKSREEQLDDKIESVLRRYERMTGRRINDYIKGYSSTEKNRALAALVESGRVLKQEEGRTWVYALPLHEGPAAVEPPAQEIPDTGEMADVPF